jgi:hypothetical protein
MNPVLKNSITVNREQWVAFLAASPQGAVYAHPDYMDVVAPGWQAIEVWRDKELMAIMPFQIRKKMGMVYSLQPSFCQFWGIFLRPEKGSGNYKSYSEKRKVVKAIVEVIPKEIRWFLYGFAPEFDYPLPFHWWGYSLRSRYSYRIELAQGYPAIEKAYGNDTRYDIRKAQEKGMTVVESQDWQRLLDLVEENASQGKQMLTSTEKKTLAQLAPFLLKSKLGMLLEVRDADQKPLGSALFGSFAGKTSYLMSATTPNGASAGAMSLLLGKAIEMSATKDSIFDFEGSMIEGIEGFFRGFGGRPVPYTVIEKNALPLFVRWIRKSR